MLEYLLEFGQLLTIIITKIPVLIVKCKGVSIGI